MREATRILSLENLLKRSIHRGVAVSQLSLKMSRRFTTFAGCSKSPASWRAKHNRREVLPDYVARWRATSARARRDWLRAVGFDLQFHSLLIRFHRNRRLESFYQRVIGELRMGMVLVDRSHDDPGGLIPVHRKMYQLLAAGKLKECAAVLVQHLDDSESRLEPGNYRRDAEEETKQTI